MTALIWILPDGKGGQIRINTQSTDPVPRPPDFEPWKAEWSGPNALAGHAIWCNLWYRQEIERLQERIMELERSARNQKRRRLHADKSRRIMAGYLDEMKAC